jgi:hypothetical protein
MSQSYVIEVGDDLVGLVLRDNNENDFRFHAASSAYQSLDGRHFASAALAEKAARAHRAKSLSERQQNQNLRSVEL